MLNVSQEVMDTLARDIFIEKLQAAFVRDVSDFINLTETERTEFVRDGIASALSKGFQTEQGIASYALAVWWLGPNFDEQSAELVALLNSNYPEVRRAHAMNEWVHEMIGVPDDICAAEKLRDALALTTAWGD